MPTGLGWRGVLCRRDLPDEGARGGRQMNGGRRGRASLGLLGRVELPLGFRRRWRLRAAHAVGAGRVVLRRGDAPQALRLGRGLLKVTRFFRMFLMVFGVVGVALRARRLVNPVGRMFAVSAGVFPRGRPHLTTHVWADDGGEDAAPAAENECPSETEIEQLTRHGF